MARPTRPLRAGMGGVLDARETAAPTVGKRRGDAGLLAVAARVRLRRSLPGCVTARFCVLVASVPDKRYVFVLPRAPSESEVQTRRPFAAACLSMMFLWQRRSPSSPPRAARRDTVLPRADYRDIAELLTISRPSRRARSMNRSPSGLARCRSLVSIDCSRGPAVVAAAERTRPPTDSDSRRGATRGRFDEHTPRATPARGAAPAGANNGAGYFWVADVQSRCATTIGSARSGAATTGTRPSRRRGSPFDSQKLSEHRAQRAHARKAQRAPRQSESRGRDRVLSRDGRRRSIRFRRRARRVCSSVRMDSRGCSKLAVRAAHVAGHAGASAGPRTSRRSRRGWPTASARTITKLVEPVRAGAQTNTAHSMTLALDYADVAARREASRDAIVSSRAKVLSRRFDVRDAKRARRRRRCGSRRARWRWRGGRGATRATPTARALHDAERSHRRRPARTRRRRRSSAAAARRSSRRA